MAVEFDKRFLESTRGKIILSLRNSGKTVNDLADEFGLTDNAVRAHLLSLERDRLVKQNGMAKGRRKPHFLYELTAEASRFFPKSYDSLLNRLLSVLRRSVQPAFLKRVLRETGRDVGSKHVGGQDTPLETRIDSVLLALSELGGAANVVRENSQIIIKSNRCPFAEVVAEHPEVCKMAESLVEEIVGVPVEEHCDRSHAPKCNFALRTT